MKILYVLDTFDPKVDGPATVINNIAKILSENKLAEIDVMVPYFPKYTDNFPYKVIRVTSLWGPDNYRTPIPQLKMNLAKIIKKGKYDIIHVHSPFTLGKWAISFAKKHKIPNIITLHTKYKSDFERKLKSKFLQNFMMNYVTKVLNKADYALTVSYGFANEIKETYNYNKKVNVIRNATEFKDTKAPDIVETLRKKHNLNDDFVCLFVGRVVKNKKIQFSLEALKQAKEKGYTNFKFLIVGEGDYRSKLEELVKKYNLEENVVFVGLISDRNELGAYYQLSDLFLFPSIFDTCGIVALEAASFELPSLMIEDTCASELIVDGDNGFIAPNDTRIWAEKLIDIIHNKDKLEKTKVRAKETLCQSWEQITMECLNYYKCVILFNKLKNSHKKEIFKNSTLRKTNIKLANKIFTPFKRFKNKNNS